MNRTQTFALLAALLGATLVATWLARHIDTREVHVPRALQGEAASNNLYAAREFLHAMGLHAETRSIGELPTALPPASSAIIIDHDREGWSDETRKAILAWVARGGHLLLRPGLNQLNEDTLVFADPLLSQLGLQARLIPDAEPDEPAEISISSNQGDEHLQVLFDEQRVLEGELANDVLMIDRQGVHLVHRAVGAGYVTVLSDMAFINNHEIGEFNHAALLWYLLNWDGIPPARIWLIHDETPASLPRLLWRHAKPVVIVAALWLGLFLLTSGYRFGPLLPPRQAPRRSLMEHIDASGRHYWRQGQQARLLTSSRQTVVHHLNQLHPQWTNLSDSERNQRLATHLHWPASRINTLLQGEIPTDRDAFTRMISDLEKLRASL